MHPFFMSGRLLMPGKELRIQDYLKVYKTTSRPPLSCPQSPNTPNARAALGLPPLFVPTAIPVASDSLDSTKSISEAPAILHTNHEFSSTKTITGEYFESISAQTPYNHFSHEVGFHRRVSHDYFPVSSMSSSHTRTRTLALSVTLPSGTSFFFFLFFSYWSVQPTNHACRSVHRSSDIAPISRGIKCHLYRPPSIRWKAGRRRRRRRPSIRFTQRTRKRRRTCRRSRFRALQII